MELLLILLPLHLGTPWHTGDVMHNTENIMIIANVFCLSSISLQNTILNTAIMFFESELLQNIT